jgi:hypothetical protein
VYCVPDPARAAERSQMGLLGELCAEPSLFEPFRNTPSLAVFRRCLNKQLSWHHELERRRRATPASTQEVPFPALVILSPGRPETVLDAFGCRAVSPGVYRAVPGLVTCLVVLAELPRRRETLLLRLLGANRILREALADLATLPRDAWEQSVATPLLLHFHVETGEAASPEAEMNAEIDEWYRGYLQRQEQLRLQAQQERRLLVRLLRSRFGELTPATLARLDAADVVELERWGERVLSAKTLAEVFDEQH